MASNPDIFLQGLIGTTGLRPIQDAQSAQLGLAQQRQQLAMNQLAMQAEQQKAQRAAAFQHDVSSYFANPSPSGLASLVGKYPEQAEALQKAYTIMDAPARQSRISQLAALYHASKNNQPELVAKRLEQVIAAEKAQGLDTSEGEDALAAVRANDPRALTYVQGFAQMHLAAADRDFAKQMGIGGEGFTLSQGQARYDSDGKLVASQAPKPEYLVVPEGGKAVPINGAPALENGAGDQSTAAGGNLVARMIPITLGSEAGGSLANPRVSPKGARGPMQVMPGTNVKPGFGVTPAADDSEAERARVGRDYLAAMMNRYGDPAKAWAAYNAGPGAVDAALAAKGPNWLQALPSETRKYVGRNMAQLQRGGATGSATTVIPRAGDPVGTIYGNPKREPAPTGYRYTPSGDLQPIPGGPADTTDGGLTPEEVNYYAQQVAAGGALPTLGMGKDAAHIRRQILARAADINIDRNISGFQANLLHADLKANTHSLSVLSNLQNQVAASERTASANAEQVLKLGPRGAAGSAPVFNRWIQAGRTALSGDPEVSAYNAAITTFANEYAKVMTTNTGTGGVTSDSARREAESLINNAQTFPQVQAVIRQMRVDMANRSRALETQRQILSGQIGGSTSPALPAPKPGQVVRGYRFKGGDPAQRTSWVKVQ